MTMRTAAVLFTGKNRVEFGEVEVPDPGPGDVVVRTVRSWISNGTEGSFLRGERVDGITAWTPDLPEPYPMVPGYQRIGVAETVGAEVEGIRDGQTVFATISPTVDTHLKIGGHLWRAPVAAGEVLALPADDDAEKYAGLVLTQVGFNAGSRPPVTAGRTTAIVIGDGLVGHWAAQTLQGRGARVALVGKHAFRLGLFRCADGDTALRASAPDWLEQARTWAGGDVDIVVDTVGNEVNRELNLRLCRNMAHDGHFVIVGHLGPRSDMDLHPFLANEITIHCPTGWTRQRLERTRDLIAAGRLDTSSLITDRFPAAHAAEAWSRISGNKDATLGVVLVWE